MSAATAGDASSNTSHTFLTALVTNSALLAIELGAFVLLKNRLNRIYSPRTYLPPPDKRANELPKGPWKWLPAIVVTPPKDIIRKNGLDAYMFLRFLRLMIVIFASFTLVTWLVLLPVDSANIGGSYSDGLAKLSWGNIPETETKRYAAHIIIVYLLTFLVLYLIRLEYMHFTHMRHEFLISPSHAHLAQARTVLITSIPPDMCSERELRIWASFVPGGVENVWVYRDTRELNKAFEARIQACSTIEAASSKLLRQAIQAEHQRHKDRRDATAAAPTSPAPPSGARMDVEYAPAFPPRVTPTALSSLVPHAQRPRHRLGFLGLWGRQVDTIEYFTSKISTLNTQIHTLRTHTHDAKPLGSAFVQCNLQMGAHVLAQCASYHEPLVMTDKWIPVAPKDVIWANIDDGAYEMRARYVTSWMASIGIIALWFFPVAFVGLLSNVSQLCAKVTWLTWVCRAPPPIPGIIQGILPPLFLAILFAVLPWILRALAWYENIPLYSLLSISVYKRYYTFLVVHGFLVVTLSSGLTATISEIVSAPTQTLSHLASQLPDASVFFLTWTITQGLTGAGAALLQIVTLLMHFIKKWFLGRTPREAYAVNFLMPSADFGTVLPNMSLLATIGFAYSVISPVINGLAMLAFILFYFAWKFLLTWVFDQPDDQETGGLYFPLVIQNLFVGLYIEQICLAALFFLKISAGVAFLAQGILMLVLLALTVTVQIFLHKAFDPLLHYLPMSLATKKMQARYERKQRKRDGAQEKREDEEFDLFDRERMRSVIRRGINAPVQAFKDGLLNPSNTGLKHPTEASSSTKSFIISATSSQELHRAMLQSSHASKPSKREPEEHAFAPLAPAPAANGDDSDSGDDSVFDEHAFDHPSAYVEQPWIWLPKDDLGLSEALVQELKASGVGASDEGASIDYQGTVEVSRNPPDETWTGGGGYNA